MFFPTPPQTAPAEVVYEHTDLIFRRAFPPGKITKTEVQAPRMVQPQAQPQSGSRKISFNVSDQYDIQDVIGEGAYGVVW